MPPKRRPALSPVLQAFDRVRGTIDASRLGLMALTLVFLRSSSEEHWASLRSAHPSDVAWQLRRLEYDLGPVVDAISASMRDMPDAAVAEIIYSVESVAQELGNEFTFQLILEELGSPRDMVLTPASVASVLAGTIDLSGASTVYDPFCRAGELLVAAAARAGDTKLAFYGDMPDAESLAIARMNVQLHQVRGALGQGDLSVQAPMAGFDYKRLEARRFSRIVSNPPFNIRDWAHGYHEYWRYGDPPKGNANFAWLQYAVERLEPEGKAAIVMANNAAFSTNRSEKHIRMRMVQDGCVEAVISLPHALFRGTGVSAMVWLLSPPGTRRNEMLFIDASEAGHMASRTLRELSEPEVSEIVQAVENWRAGHSSHTLVETINCAAVTLPEINDRDYNLNPSNFMARPYIPPSPAEAMPRIGQLMDKLEAEYMIARDQDWQAVQAVKDILP